MPDPAGMVIIDSPKPQILQGDSHAVVLRIGCRHQDMFFFLLGPII